MKLGILVVYLVSDNNERLLEIHLNKIKECTTSPFTIYAGTNLLLPQFVDKLREYDFIKQCYCTDYNGPDENTRGTKEQSHYVEQLINAANKDKVSHLVIMHPDSFPIKVGWEKYLANKLSKSCVLVSNFPAMSACTFFSRDFYFKYRPRLLPSAQEELSESWINFQKANQTPHLVETGMGFAHLVTQKNLIWYKLNRSNRGEYHNYFGSIFEDVLFHLGSASEYQTRPMRGYVKDSNFHNLKQVVADLLSFAIKEKIKNILPNEFLYPEEKKNKDDFFKIRKALLNETEKFLNFLINGK